MAFKQEQITTVTIFNQTYKIKSGDDAAYVRTLADVVDRKMKELSQLTPTVDSLKVAILAAMYIADDLQAAKRQIDRYSAEVESKVQLMVQQLEPLLQDSTRQLPPETEL